MAKFKVGDKVKFTAGPIKGETAKVLTVRPNGRYDVRSVMGEILTNTPEDDLLAANSLPVSSNSVVANAVAAQKGAANSAPVARNADDKEVKYYSEYLRQEYFRTMDGLKGVEKALAGLAKYDPNGEDGKLAARAATKIVDGKRSIRSILDGLV